MDGRVSVNRSGAQMHGGPSRCWLVTGVTGAGLALASPTASCGGGEDSCPTLPSGDGAPSSQSLQLQAMGLPEVSSLFHGQGKGRAHQQEGPGGSSAARGSRRSSELRGRGNPQNTPSSPALPCPAQPSPARRAGAAPPAPKGRWPGELCAIPAPLAS